MGTRALSATSTAPGRTGSMNCSDMLMRPSGSIPTSSPWDARRMAVFVACVSIPPRFTGMTSQFRRNQRNAGCSQNSRHHPVHRPAGTALHEQGSMLLR